MSQLWVARPSKSAVAGKRSLGRVSCLPSTAKHRAAPTGGLLGRATHRFNRIAALAAFLQTRARARDRARARARDRDRAGSAWNQSTSTAGAEHDESANTRVQGWSLPIRSQTWAGILLAFMLCMSPSVASPVESGQPLSKQDASSPDARSPYRWFILVGFIAGGLFTAWRIRARRRRRDDQCDVGDLR